MSKRRPNGDRNENRNSLVNRLERIFGGNNNQRDRQRDRQRTAPLQPTNRDASAAKAPLSVASRGASMPTAAIYHPIEVNSRPRIVDPPVSVTPDTSESTIVPQTIRPSAVTAAPRVPSNQGQQTNPINTSSPVGSRVPIAPQGAQDSNPFRKRMSDHNLTSRPPPSIPPLQPRKPTVIPPTNVSGQRVNPAVATIVTMASPPSVIKQASVSDSHQADDASTVGSTSSQGETSIEREGSHIPPTIYVNLQQGPTIQARDEPAAVEPSAIPTVRNTELLRSLARKQPYVIRVITPASAQKGHDVSSIMFYNDGIPVPLNTTLGQLKTGISRLLDVQQLHLPSRLTTAFHPICNCNFANSIVENGIWEMLRCRIHNVQTEDCDYPHEQVSKDSECSICLIDLTKPCQACEVIGETDCPLVVNAGCRHTFHHHCYTGSTNENCPAGCARSIALALVI
jgi:hypothetical protein